MQAAKYYVGAEGARYYSRRGEVRSHSTQQWRAGLFADIVTPTDTIVDFGCGNGAVLGSLNAAHRMGVEINELAVAEAGTVLDKVYSRTEDIPDMTADVAISYHALEHVDSPASVLRELHRVLRPGGLLRLVVPCEMPLIDVTHRSWKARDPNMHLFGWSPLTLGNLVSVHGFDILDSKLLPDSQGGRLAHMFGWTPRMKDWFRYLKALRTGRFEVRLTARKPEQS